MHTSNTLSSLHISHSFGFLKVRIVLKAIGRFFAAQPNNNSDFSASLCPLL